MMNAGEVLDTIVHSVHVPDDVLAKPFDPDKLAELLRRYGAAAPEEAAAHSIMRRPRWPIEPVRSVMGGHRSFSSAPRHPRPAMVRPGTVRHAATGF